jgi:hypothetical protein
MQQARWHVKMGAPALIAVSLALIAGFVFGLSSAGGVSAGDQPRTAAGGIPRSTREIPPIPCRFSWDSR